MNGKKRMAIVIGLLTPFLFGCLCCGGCGMEEQKKEITAAHELWNSGNKAEAVARYKSVYTSMWTDTIQKQQMLPRIVEHETKAGNLDEAKTWIRRGLSDHLKVEYTEPAVKELFDAAQKGT